MELSVLKQSDNNNDKDDGRVEVHPENGGCSDYNTPNATEDSGLLSDSQVAENGDHSTVGYIPDDFSGQSSNECLGNLGRLKNELSEPVCWKLKVWMLILIIFTIIVLAIFLAVFFCSVPQKDVDDEYNPEEFVVPRFFRGNFTLHDTHLTLDEESQSKLEQKLTHIYTSSYALGRYFSNATVNPLRNSNSSVEYKLKFMMPKEPEQIIKYTLSKEMVYNVLLQQLSDEEPEEDPLYIELPSLTMEVVS